MRTMICSVVLAVSLFTTAFAQTVPPEIQIVIQTVEPTPIAVMPIREDILLVTFFYQNHNLYVITYLHAAGEDKWFFNTSDMVAIFQGEKLIWDRDTKV